MSKGIVEKLLNLIGLEQEIVEQEAPEETEEAEEPQNYPARGRKKAPVVSLPPQRNIRVVLVQPAAFDEVEAVAEHLRNRRPVLVNLERADKEAARRIVDFLSGAAYGLAGTVQRVGNGIFLFAPSNVDVSAPRDQAGGAMG
ncbi:MAG: cell division protein SepF [Bacillota bacterium]